MTFADSWLDPAVAFDGWVGATLGAVISFLVALFVLRRTLLTEQNQRLRDQLERALGALRAADPRRDPRPDHQHSDNNRDREDSTGHHRTGP